MLVAVAVAVVVGRGSWVVRDSDSVSEMGNGRNGMAGMAGMARMA